MFSFESSVNKKEQKDLVTIRLLETPIPIPNMKVKGQTAENTALEAVWESRRLPSK